MPGRTAVLPARCDDDKDTKAEAGHVFRGVNTGLSKTWSLSPTANWKYV